MPDFYLLCTFIEVLTGVFVFLGVLIYITAGFVQDKDK